MPFFPLALSFPYTPLDKHTDGEESVSFGAPPVASTRRVRSLFFSHYLSLPGLFKKKVKCKVGKLKSENEADVRTTLLLLASQVPRLFPLCRVIYKHTPAYKIGKPR